MSFKPAVNCNPLDHLAIQNVLAKYCEALDSKDFGMLDEVFLSNVSADYPFNHELEGVGAVKAAIKNRLGPILTHHALSTQRITFDDSNAEKAYATTYFTGSHFGQGTHEGKVLQAYGKYEDELVLLDDYADYDGVTGASGRWRIISRKVKFTKRIGDERIMSEF